MTIASPSLLNLTGACFTVSKIQHHQCTWEVPSWSISDSDMVDKTCKFGYCQCRDVTDTVSLDQLLQVSSIQQEEDWTKNRLLCVHLTLLRTVMMRSV